MNYLKFLEFREKLPQEDRTQFQALVEEDTLVAKTSQQAAVDADDAASRFMMNTVVI